MELIDCMHFMQLQAHSSVGDLDSCASCASWPVQEKSSVFVLATPSPVPKSPRSPKYISSFNVSDAKPQNRLHRDTVQDGNGITSGLLDDEIDFDISPVM